MIAAACSRINTSPCAEDLAAHRGLGFAGYDRPSQWTLARGRRHVGVEVPMSLISDDAEFLMSAAVDGRGVMPATDWLADRDVARGRLVRVLPEWTLGATGAIWIVLPSSRFVPARTRAFADWIVDAVRALPSWTR